MGMGLRGGNRSPNNESTNGSVNYQPSVQRVVTKKNTLKDLVAGEGKQATVKSSHSGESNDLVMSLRGGFGNGSDNGNEFSSSQGSG